jgi:hypothetical protein
MSARCDSARVGPSRPTVVTRIVSPVNFAAESAMCAARPSTKTVLPENLDTLPAPVVLSTSMRCPAQRQRQWG